MKTNQNTKTLLCISLVMAALLSACTAKPGESETTEPPAATHSSRTGEAVSEKTAESSKDASEKAPKSKPDASEDSGVSSSNPESEEESSASPVSEDGVQQSLQRWETQAAEFDALEAFCRKNLPLAALDASVRTKDNRQLSCSYHIIDTDGDGHLELLVGPSSFFDDDFINSKDREGIEIEDDSYLYRLEDGEVKGQFLMKGMYQRGDHYCYLAVPRKEDGKVVGLEGIQFFYFGTFNGIVQPGDLISYSFQWVRPEGLETQASYSFYAYRSGESSLGFDYYDTTGEEKIEYSSSQMQSLIKERHSLVLEPSGYTISPIPENGNNVLYKRLGHYSDYLLYDSDTRVLTFEDLEAMLRRNHCTDDVSRKKYLELARNEPAAIYGHAFGTPYMKDYFESKPWYTATGEMEAYIEQHDGHSQLSEIEQANIALIEAYESLLGLDDVTVS